MDLDRIKPVLERWVRSLKNERLKYRLYAWDNAEGYGWDNEKGGVWVHLRVTVRKDGSEYSRYQVLTKRQLKELL